MKIGITIGDVAGVGPEVTLKAVASEIARDDCSYVLIGEVDVLKRESQRLKIDLDLEGGTTGSRVRVLNPADKLSEDNIYIGSSAVAKAAVEWLKYGAELCLKGELDGLVTAPVNKESIIRAGIPFVGQTEFLSALAKTERTAMMLLGDGGSGRWVRVVLVTTHVPIRKLPDSITGEKVKLAIEMADLACRLLGLERRKIGVCGLNPHSGEGGKLGDEEVRVIGPAVKEMEQKGYNVYGPISADALFHHHYTGEYDVVVAMYHDQGLAPLKMVAFENGINWTVGLPFIRTSPDHGTAYDIAGQNKANPSSMIAAVRLAKKLVQNAKRRVV